MSLGPTEMEPAIQLKALSPGLHAPCLVHGQSVPLAWLESLLSSRQGEFDLGSIETGSLSDVLVGRVDLRADRDGGAQSLRT